MKRLRSWIGIALTVVITISVLIALTAPVTAIHEVSESRSGEEHATSFGAMKNLMEQRMKLLPEGLEMVGGNYNISQMTDGKRMSAYPDLSENFLTLWGTATNPDTQESQSRGEHLVGTRKRELQSRTLFGDLVGVNNEEKQTGYQKELWSEMRGMRGTSEALQPIE